MTAPNGLPASARLLWRGWPLLQATGVLAWGLRVDRAGGFPPPPFVVAANHFSHLDPMLVGLVYRRPILFLAVDELYGIHRPLDLALDLVGVMPITRTGVPLGAMRASLHHLAAGGVVGVFPEGTRVRTWGEHRPKPGAAWLAARAGVPLVPVAIAGTDRAFGVDNRPGRARIRVRVGPPLRATGRARPEVDALTTRWWDWTEGALGGM